jgi:transcriptional regulator GlxA family with amidase domain
MPRRPRLQPPPPAAPAAPPRLNVAIVPVARFTLTALATFVDCLRLAADEDDRSRPLDCRWTLLGDPSRAAVTASCGIEIGALAEFGEPDDYDYVVVFGGLMHGGQRVSAATTAFLRRAARRGIPLAGVCTGSFVLARAGLMDGYRCCVSWFHHQDFVAEFPQHDVVSDEIFVVDRDRLTCAGGTSAAHLAAYLVARHCGKARAVKSLRIMQENQALPPGTPQPVSSIATDAHDPLVRRALLLMEQQSGGRLAVADIAGELGVSVRQLERRFRADLGKPPQALGMALRLTHGRWLLLHSRRPVTEIALECGFADGAHFARSFRGSFGRSPTEFRETVPAA